MWGWVKRENKYMKAPFDGYLDPSAVVFFVCGDVKRKRAKKCALGICACDIDYA